MGILKNDDILITSTQLTVGDETYMLSGVMHIKKEKCNNRYPRALALVIISFCLGGMIGMSEVWCIVGILFSPIIAIWEGKNQKALYWVHLGMPSGAFKVLESEDEGYIDEIIATLKGAVACIHRPIAPSS